MKLIFGVWNIPYGTDNTTTGDVANQLEKRYGIMGHFVGMQKKMIAREVMEEILGTLQKRKPQHPMDAISTRLKQAISNREFDGIPGVPTKAAQMGISTRFKGGKRKGSRRDKVKRTGVARPSFIDSGLYQASIRVVLDESK
jgi:hypothetical protein